MKKTIFKGLVLTLVGSNVLANSPQIDNKNPHALLNNEVYNTKFSSLHYKNLIRNSLLHILDTNINYKELQSDFKISQKVNSIKSLFNSLFQGNELQIDDLEQTNLEVYINEIFIHSNLDIQNSQYFVYVDTSSQRIHIFYYDSVYNKIFLIGSDKVTTGNYKLGNKFFNTPNIIIDRTKYKDNDWQAEGTGKMGFGPKGSTIRYLGKHIITKDGKQFSDKIGGGFFELTLAMHTSNYGGNKKLGQRVSHGCIRVSKNMLKFLDESKILEGNNGKYLIIGDKDNNLTKLKKDLLDNG